ncbi:MAG: hypothetical protein U1E70_20475 [Acetobacteraceae bacterium]
MASGAAFSAVVLACGFLLPPLALPTTNMMADRLAFAARADLFVALWLLASVAAVAKGRFFSPQDIAGSGFGEPTPTIAAGRAVVQNTHEQATLAVIAHLALATLLPFRLLGLIPLLVVLFCIGRLTFWLGYQRGAAARAFGFATTFYPTAMALVVALVMVVVLGV